MIAHPVFNQKILDLKFPLLGRIANYFLSLGGIGYYLHDKDYSTRIIIFNNFSFLANSDFGAEWSAEVYSSGGKLIFKKKGFFSKQETVVIDMKDVKPESPHGLISVHIKPLDKGRILGKTFDTVFFTEHYHRDGIYNDVAHSLRWLTPVKYYYEAVGHGFSILPEATPFLLVANSYQRKVNLPRFYATGTVEIINHSGEVRKVNIPKIPSAGCHRINLLEEIPDIREHMNNMPGLIRVVGYNIARRPFFYQTNGKFISSDHL